MATISEASMAEVHRDARKREAQRRGPMEFCCGIFDLNDAESRGKYKALVTAEGHDGSGKVEITMRKERWVADGRMLMAAAWWQPTDVGEAFTPDPVGLVRNTVVHQGD